MEQEINNADKWKKKNRIIINGFLKVIHNIPYYVIIFLVIIKIMEIYNDIKYKLFFQ